MSRRRLECSKGGGGCCGSGLPCRRCILQERKKEGQIVGVAFTFRLFKFYKVKSFHTVSGPSWTNVNFI